MATLARDHEVVFLTGRPQHLAAVTERWLDDHALGGHRLVMRPDGDRRPAAVLKVEVLARLAEGREVGVVVDTFHLWWDPELPAQIARAGVEGRIAAFQVCDWVTPIAADPLLSRGIPGDGDIDFAAFTALVHATGYSGDIECEVFRQEIWDADPGHVARRSAAAYRRLVAPHL